MISKCPSNGAISPDSSGIVSNELSKGTVKWIVCFCHLQCYVDRGLGFGLIVIASIFSGFQYKQLLVPRLLVSQLLPLLCSGYFVSALTLPFLGRWVGSPSRRSRVQGQYKIKEKLCKVANTSQLL